MQKKLSYFLRKPLQLPIIILTKFIPYFKFLYQTSDYQNRVNFYFWFKQKVLNYGGNKNVYWPVHFTSKVFDPENIHIGVDAYPGIMGGCYITGRGGLYIGDYTQIAPNVVIVTANHDIYDSRKHIEATVKIGKYCWIGAGAKILPGVELGDWTIVGSGAVVTKSFTDGYCVIGGIPAIKIKELDKEKCIPFYHKFKFYGYLSENKFEAYRKRKLNV
jgi:acetyltransferase-like isoleucine patch superfamily enzyme